MNVIGHRGVVAVLERRLPPVTLLTGPASVGKWTIAEHLAMHHRVAPVDRFVADPLTAEAARRLVRWAQKARFNSPFKLALVRLDAASPTALNALLKTLEEPPAEFRFILVASAPTLPTIASRAQIFRLGLLTDDELADVLIAQGMTGAQARRLARLGKGQVSGALQAESMTASRTAALTIVQALARGDATLFDKAFAGFDEQAFWLLRVWFEETITTQWRWFTAAETYGLGEDRKKLYAMFLALNALPAARPRLGVRAALEPFLSA